MVGRDGGVGWGSREGEGRGQGMGVDRAKCMRE